MTAYEHGFMTKCAERGVPPDVAVALLKSAQAPQTHTVAPGETIFGIARRYGLDQNELSSWNGISDPSRIGAGQTLRLSAPSAPAPARVPAPAPVPAPPPVPPAPSAPPASRPGRLTEDDKAKVNAFYDNIMLEKQRRFGGTPGVDYDDTFYYRGFADDTPVQYDASGDDGGFVDPMDWNYRTHLNPGLSGLDRMMTAVHELKHIQNGDSRFVTSLWNRSGLSDGQWGLLDNAYGFGAGDTHYSSPSDTRSEMSTTNAQYQFAIFDELSRRLGRAATYDEFANYVNNMGYADMKRILKLYPNAYVRNALLRRFPANGAGPTNEALERMRRAWLMADNGNGATAAGSVA